ncbi:hypothetical protein N0V84_002538 [Fusarium piperis]|uniref:DNA2/NAM7 helicase-like C-terminal domain-containing protein n=1 Tax=Fusarium piperis TaxID=1435070 RepID=A0A9W8WJ29_9HYPO|nr:hypothetical protein N0V84_002538 [Fusarium piperis]
MPRSSRKKALVHDSDSGSENSSRDVGFSKSWPCAVFLDEENQKSIGKFRSPGFFKETEAFLTWSAKPHAEPWMGFSIRFILGRRNDDDGFGVRYKANLKYGIPTPLRKYWLLVKFPRGRFTYTAEAVTKGHSLHGRVWKKKTEFTLLKVSLEKDSHAKIDGYCVPFANPGNVAHTWFNDNAPIAGSKPLPELLDQRTFTILVCSEDVLSRWNEATLPKPFSYTYGKQHTWDMDRYQTMLPKVRGGQFAPAWSFHDDNSHLAALTQSQVQGAMWLRNAADRIATLEFSALFIDAGVGTEGTTYYVIVSIGKHYKSEVPSVWWHLAGGEILQLSIHKDPEAVEWDARILHHPQHIDIFESSDLNEFQLVLTPSDVAVDNLAFRLDQTTFSVTNRLNANRKSNNTTRAKCRLIVQGYRMEDEIDAFFNLLQNPQAGDQAVPSSTWEDPRAWKLHLSLAFWLLAVLQSPSVRSLRPDDSPGLHQMRDGINMREKLGPLLAVARGDIAWSEYQFGGNQVPVATIGKLLTEILHHADIVCTSPALFCSKQDPYRNWKNELAKGIAVDDAGSISRPDLYSVWGNTLLPCLLAGDDCQIPPAVEGFEVQDKRGNYINRLGQHGKISSLAFLEASGWPIFRLRTQLRMPQSLFELCDQGIFLEGHFEHRPSSDFEHSHYEIGRKLELYLTNKYQDLAPVVSDTFHESTCNVNQITGSKQNPVQVQVALDFVTDFIKCKKANVSDIIIISAEKANADLVEHRRKGPGYLELSGMKLATTIEGFQGCESKIVVAILGVTQKVGPKPLDDNRRLAAMLSRATCGLVIVGDINTLGKKQATAGSSGHKSKGRKRSVAIKLRDM